MILILEAPDRCGKSTQVQKLIHLFHDKSIHQLHYSSVKGFKEKWEIKNYSCRMYSDMFKLLYSNYKDMHFILDRSHLGEMIYGPMYRNYDGDYVLNIENYWKDFEDFWNEIYLITFIDTPVGLVARDDGLSFSTDLEKKTKEVELFKKAYDKSLIKHKFLIDIENLNEDEVFEKIKGFIFK